ncbi:MAG: hypothetical protein ACPLQO_09140, partial [Desulfotomaculales bacterium]
MFKRSLKGKIMLAFAVVLLCMLGLSLFACREINNIEKIYGELFALRIDTRSGWRGGRRLQGGRGFA